MLNTTEQSDRRGRRVCLLLCMALLAMAPTRYAAATGVGYVPSAVEAFILETVLADEVRALEQGGQTALFAHPGASPPNGATSASAVQQQFAAFYRGDRVADSTVARMAIVIAMTAAQLEQPDHCLTDQRICSAAIRRAGPTREDAEGLRQVVQRFQSAGLDLSAFEPAATPPPA